MHPLLIAGIGLSTLYATGKTADSVRFWDDYRKNTGFRPRYPWRAGKYDFVRDYSHLMSGYGAYARFTRVTPLDNYSRYVMYR